MHKLKKMIEKGKKVVVVVVGGDGTVTWVISEFANFDIDADLAPIAIIPVGTGNDFSQELGWGTDIGNITSNNYEGLKSMISKWIDAREEYFDLWEMESEVFE